MGFELENLSTLVIISKGQWTWQMPSACHSPPCTYVYKGRWRAHSSSFCFLELYEAYAYAMQFHSLQRSSRFVSSSACDIPLGISQLDPMSKRAISSKCKMSLDISNHCAFCHVIARAGVGRILPCPLLAPQGPALPTSCQEYSFLSFWAFLSTWQCVMQRHHTQPLHFQPDSASCSNAARDTTRQVPPAEILKLVLHCQVGGSTPFWICTARTEPFSRYRSGCWRRNASWHSTYKCTQ